MRYVPNSRSARGWLLLGGSLGLLFLMILGLAISRSRGAWIALACAMTLASLWVAAGWLGRKSRTSRAWMFLSLLVVPVSAAVVIQGFWPGGLLALPSALPGQDTWVSRLEFQRNSLLLLRDYPLIGGGLASFKMLYSTYALLSHVGFIRHSHNTFLNVAIAQGIPGLLCLVWMWALFFLVVWNRVLKPQAASDAGRLSQTALGAAALSLLVILIHGWVDNALYGRDGVSLLFVPLAFAVLAVPSNSTRPFQSRLRFLLPSAALVVGLLIWWRPLMSVVYSNLGAIHQSQTELRVYTWPEWPVQDQVRRVVDLGQPVAEFERALTLYPRNSTANRRLGMIRLSQGEYQDALHHLRLAHEVEPESVTTQQLLGEALIVNGRLGEGRKLWDSVNNEHGQLALRAFWYSHIGDAERADWIEQAVRGE
jgi:hypothetical protein